MPVIASDSGGRYVPDLKVEEFTVSEDNAEQKVAFFATVTEPFSVVLMIDTSASATVEKLRQVQEAAVAFTEQLREGDRVNFISFDDEIRDLCDFTNDRGVLASAIRSTRRGKGTRLYDAFDQAYRALRRLKGRKAVMESSGRRRSRISATLPRSVPPPRRSPASRKWRATRPCGSARRYRSGAE